MYGIRSEGKRNGDIEERQRRKELDNAVQRARDIAKHQADIDKHMSAVQSQKGTKYMTRKIQ